MDTFTNTGEAESFIDDMPLDETRRVLRMLARENPRALDGAIDGLSAIGDLDTWTIYSASGEYTETAVSAITALAQFMTYHPDDNVHAIVCDLPEVAEEVRLSLTGV